MLSWSRQKQTHSVLYTKWRRHLAGKQDRQFNWKIVHHMFINYSLHERWPILAHCVNNDGHQTTTCCRQKEPTAQYLTQMNRCQWYLNYSDAYNVKMKHSQPNQVVIYINQSPVIHQKPPARVVIGGRAAAVCLVQKPTFHWLVYIKSSHGCYPSNTFAVRRDRWPRIRWNVELRWWSRPTQVFVTKTLKINYTIA